MNTNQTITIELDPDARTITIRTPQLSIPLLAYPITDQPTEISRYILLRPFGISLRLAVWSLTE